MNWAVGFFGPPCSCLCLAFLETLLDCGCEVTCIIVFLFVCSDERITGGMWCWLSICGTLCWWTVLVTGICSICWRPVVGKFYQKWAVNLRFQLKHLVESDFSEIKLYFFLYFRFLNWFITIIFSINYKNLKDKRVLTWFIFLTFLWQSHEQN